MLELYLKLTFCLPLQHQQRADEMSALAQQQPGFDSFNNQSGGAGQNNTSGDNSAAAENSAADATFNAVAANASNNSGQFENMGYDQVTCLITHPKKSNLHMSTSTYQHIF